MCQIIKKLLEWFAMLNLIIYSVLTLSYVTVHTCLSIGVLYFDHEDATDYLVFLFGLLVSTALYI